MDAPIELRQLRYFVAVAEELHFGRAAERLHMSQSPLSRAIRELERDLGVVLFVRTTRRVELTAAGTALLGRARRAIAEVDLAVDDARRAGAEPGVAIGHGPLEPDAGPAAGGRARRPGGAARRGRVPGAAATGRRARADRGGRARDARRRRGRPASASLALRDEPLLAARPGRAPLAGAGAVPLAAFAAERVLLPREPIGTRVHDLAARASCASPATSCTRRWRR